MKMTIRLIIVSLCALSVAAWQSTTPQSRRAWWTRLVVDTTAVVAVTGTRPAWAAVDTRQAIDELEQCIEKMKPIPDLLEANEWDKVRTILKLPPVNKLWNLGDVRALRTSCVGAAVYTYELC